MTLILIALGALVWVLGGFATGVHAVVDDRRACAVQRAKAKHGDYSAPPWGKGSVFLIMVFFPILVAFVTPFWVWSTVTGRALEFGEKKIKPDSAYKDLKIKQLEESVARLEREASA